MDPRVAHGTIMDHSGVMHRLGGVSMIRPFFNIVYSYTPICHGHGNVEYLFVKNPRRLFHVSVGSATMADIIMFSSKMRASGGKEVSVHDLFQLSFPRFGSNKNRGYHFHMSDSSVETFRPSLATQTMND